MKELKFGRGDYARQVADAAEVLMRNRFLEGVPVLSERPVSAIARPALKKFSEVGSGPVRHTFSAPGVFSDALFVVSDTRLHRVSAQDGSSYVIGSLSSNPLGDISMGVVASIEDVPSRLFFTEGSVLWVYTENGEAQGALTADSIVNGDAVRIGDVYYQFTNASVDAGTPAGTVGAPWLVAFTGAVDTSLQNLFDAVGDTGVPGVAYSTALVVHPTVRATGLTARTLGVSAKAFGTAGNAIVTTETGAGMAWGVGALAGGGAEQLRQVRMPEGYGAISLASINSFVIVVPTQDDGSPVGRFYWIEPGETFIDELNFATAERSQDRINQVRVYGDKFWLAGQNTIEAWIVVGDLDAPMQRFSGVIFDRGTWEGTVVQIKDSLVLVDEEGGVFRIAGGQERISRPDIEERIRGAMQTQAATTA